MSESDSGSTGRSPRRTDSLLWILFWCVALTGALPYLFAREAMNPSLAAAALAHVAGGILLLAGLRRLATEWVRGTTSRIGIGRLLPLANRRGVPLLFATIGLTGAFLLVVAAIGQSIGHWRGMYVAHVACGLFVAALVVVSWALSAGQRLGTRRPRVTSPALPVASLVVMSCGALAATHYAAESYFNQLTAATPAQANNPLFPAGTNILRPDDWNEAPTPDSCGEAGCHPRIVKAWRQSPHALSTSSRAYRDSLASAAARLGPQGTNWCAGCHEPLSLTPSGGSTHPQGRGSVDCLSCHAMAAVHSAAGNGHADYAPPPVYPFAQPKSPGERWVRGFLLRVRPAPHRAGFAGPPGNRISSAMCAPCHRLSVNAPQNGYKFLPFDETWAEWQAGPYSGESAHVFQSVPKQASCADCHFPSQSGWDAAGPVHNHGGMEPSGRTSDQTNPRRPGDGAGLRVELFALRREMGTGKPARFDAPLGRVPVRLAPGETATVEVLVENSSIGHSFPAGIPSARSAWLEVEARTVGGLGDTKTQPRAGEAAEDRDATTPLVPSTHERHGYGLWALNRGGKLVGRDDFYTMVAPIMLRSLPAGEGEVARFQFKMPSGGARTIRLTARLMSGPQGYYSPKRMHGPSKDPTVLAADSVTLAVLKVGGPSNSMPLHTGNAADAPRFFAYGVALLRPNADPLQVAQARSALRDAIRLRPNEPDYVTALGRAYLADGDLLSARAQLEQALKLDSRSPRARAWLGSTLLRMGQLEAALAILSPLSREYPRDGALWIDIGLCYLKGAKYEPAANAFAKALEVDPNDSTAHYNLMRCYTALNRLTEARREEAIFRALQDDEPLTNLVEPFLQAHPSLRREMLGMHAHRLEVRQ